MAEYRISRPIGSTRCRGKLAEAPWTGYAKVMKRLGRLACILLLAGCGREAGLRPAAGRSLPVKPLMARETPTAEQLLTPPVYARPERVDELVKRSRPRPQDPFDLPPPTGGSAPSQPAGTDPGAVTNNTTVSNPGE